MEDAGLAGDLFELPVAFVAIEAVGGGFEAVDEDVDAAVLVVVAEGYADGPVVGGSSMPAALVMLVKVPSPLLR